jgi:hypothetical protein
MDSLFLLTVPQEVKSVVMKQSLRRTDSKTGESIDILQEQRNMALKSWIPADGVPKLYQWGKASSLQHLMEVSII